MNRQKAIIMAVAATVVLVLAAPASAQPGVKPWKFTIAPYAWMAGIDGETTRGPVRTDLDMDFGDVWDDFEIGGMLQLEARKDESGLFVQPNYLRLTDEDILEVADGEIETEFWMVEFGTFYRLAESKGELPMTFDFIFGGRYWDIRNEIRFDLPMIDESNRRFSETYIDPIVGLRLNAYISKRFYIRIRGDAGGFGIGGTTTEMSWQGQGLLGFDAGKALKLFAGYRILEIDTDSGQNTLDTRFYGPVIGVGFHF